MFLEIMAAQDENVFSRPEAVQCWDAVPIKLWLVFGCDASWASGSLFANAWLPMEVQAAFCRWVDSTSLSFKLCYSISVGLVESSFLNNNNELLVFIPLLGLHPPLVFIRLYLLASCHHPGVLFHSKCSKLSDFLFSIPWVMCKNVGIPRHQASGIPRDCKSSFELKEPSVWRNLLHNNGSDASIIA